MTKDERQALKRLKTDENIVILPADKGRVTVVMDKTDYYDKMDTLVNDKLRISPQERFEAFVNNLAPSSNSKLVLNFRLNQYRFFKTPRQKRQLRFEAKTRNSILKSSLRMTQFEIRDSINWRKLKHSSYIYKKY